ncbi:MAG: ATP-binding cassette domain-containing protein [Litorimonas sp.]
MLALKGVSKSYGRTAVLSRLDARFDPGVTVITGPSGVGKSTLLRLCATVERPTAGQMIWKDAPLKGNAAFRSVLGYAPQRIDFPEDLSGLDFMMHVAALKRLPLDPARQQSLALLDRLGLARDADKRIAAWSGGMRRRLGVAQSLLGAPEMLVLDEPTAELDSGTASHVNALIFEHAPSAVILMTTHLEDHLGGHDYGRLRLDAAS